ncbi:MAG: TonB-dependent receptor [Candidatus Saelkia tenebricola]|nr:TonB-dependent receptor [Candidatus Saelkia tenebricola]
MRKVLMVLSLVSCICLAVFKDGNSEVVGLDSIVITSYSNLRSVSKYDVPYRVDVFNESDIEKSGASTVLDFLKKVGGVNVSDWYGTGVKANVDLMGFGETASSNLLLLVNGRRVNDVDMSGIDWTQVDINNVEKIEVLKGGGVVLYGDNAVGGVINVVTKKPSADKLTGSVGTKVGSYSLDEESFEVGQAFDKFSFYLTSSHSGTEGYRKNSHYYSDNISAYLESQFLENTIATLDIGYHDYRYGLPGALYDTDIGNGYSRRDTKYPGDHASMEDSYCNLGLKHSFSDATKVVLTTNFRNKNGKDFWDESGYSIDRSIQNKGFRVELLKDFDILNFPNSLIAGLDFYHANFSADKDDYLEPWGSVDDWTDIDRDTRAVFMQNELSISERAKIVFGARRQKEKITFDYTPKTGAVVDDKVEFSKEAYEVGLNYRWREKTNTFLHFARGFRVPKTDEYFSVWASPPVNQSLLTQSSKTLTAGINSQLNEKANFDFNIFYMKIDNELYWDPIASSNTTYEGTKRLGFDSGFNFRPFENLLLNCFYTYVDAQYRKGDYKGKSIPMVPEHSFKTDISYLFSNGLTFYLDLLYRSSVYQINDPSNIYKKGDSYWVTNMKIDYKYKDNWSFYLGINNLLDEEYSEYVAYSTMCSKNGIYPSPGRNYYAGVKYSF